MSKTSIGLGVILALVLVYSRPAFAGDYGPSGADGMLSAYEMKQAMKQGITFDRPGKGPAGGMQGNLGGKSISANAISHAVRLGQGIADGNPGDTGTRLREFTGTATPFKGAGGYNTPSIGTTSYVDNTGSDSPQGIKEAGHDAYRRQIDANNAIKATKISTNAFNDPWAGTENAFVP